MPMATIKVTSLRKELNRVHSSIDLLDKTYEERIMLLGSFYTLHRLGLLKPGEMNDTADELGLSDCYNQQALFDYREGFT